MSGVNLYLVQTNYDFKSIPMHLDDETSMVPALNQPFWAVLANQSFYLSYS